MEGVARVEDHLRSESLSVVVLAIPLSSRDVSDLSDMTRDREDSRPSGEVGRAVILPAALISDIESSTTSTSLFESAISFFSSAVRLPMLNDFGLMKKLDAIFPLKGYFV